jgi:hypothetical protein
MHERRPRKSLSRWPRKVAVEHPELRASDRSFKPSCLFDGDCNLRKIDSMSIFITYEAKLNDLSSLTFRLDYNNS